MRQIRREVTLTPGPVIVRGNMSARNKKKKKFADYVLSWEPGVPFSGYNGNFNPEAYDVAKVNVELMKYLRWSWARSLTWEVAQ